MERAHTPALKDHHNHFAEMQLFIPAVEYIHHMLPSSSGEFHQHPAWARTLIPKMEAFCTMLDAHLEQHAFMAGEEFSVADITAYIGSTIATSVGIGLSALAVRAWRERIAQRVVPKVYFRSQVSFFKRPDAPCRY